MDMITLLIVIYVVFISLGLPDSLFGVVWPVVHDEFGIEVSFASLYSLIVGACTGGVSFIAGKVIRKFGTSKVTFVSIILTAVGLIGISFSPNIVVMMLFAVVLGYGAGAIDTGLNNFVSLHYKAQHMNWLHCFWGVGVTLSPIIMSRFLTGEVGSWRSGYRVIAIMQLAIAVIVAFSFKKWKRIEVSEAPDESDEKKAPDKGFVQIIKMRGVLISMTSIGLYCAMEFLIGTWGATYLVNVFAVSPSEAAKWISIYYGGIMLGRFISGFVSMKLSDNMMIRAGVITAIIGVVVIMLPVGKTSIVGFLLVGLGFGPIFPSIIHSIPSRFGKEYSADITGYHMGGAYALGFAAQLIFGYVAAATTFAITPFVVLAICAGLFAANEAAVAACRRAL